jgi:hypothetical protein
VLRTAKPRQFGCSARPCPHPLGRGLRLSGSTCGMYNCCSCLRLRRQRPSSAFLSATASAEAVFGLPLCDCVGSGRVAPLAPLRGRREAPLRRHSRALRSARPSSRCSAYGTNVWLATPICVTGGLGLADSAAVTCPIDTTAACHYAGTGLVSYDNAAGREDGCMVCWPKTSKRGQA